MRKYIFFVLGKKNKAYIMKFCNLKNFQPKKGYFDIFIGMRTVSTSPRYSKKNL